MDSFIAIKVRIEVLKVSISSEKSVSNNFRNTILNH